MPRTTLLSFLTQRMVVPWRSAAAADSGRASDAEPNTDCGANKPRRTSAAGARIIIIIIVGSYEGPGRKSNDDGRGRWVGAPFPLLPSLLGRGVLQPRAPLQAPEPIILSACCSLACCSCASSSFRMASDESCGVCHSTHRLGFVLRLPPLRRRHEAWQQPCARRRPRGPGA